MSATGDFMPAVTSPAPDATFQVERVEWTSHDRLEVVGRWFGVRGRRFLRPMLEVEVNGFRRRMLALLEHKPWAADEGQEWIAAFAWEGRLIEPAVAELAVGPNLVVPLPSPVVPATEGASSAGTERPTRPIQRRLAAGPLETELAATRAEVVRLGNELDRSRAAQAAEAEERRRLTDELARVRAALGVQADKHSRRLTVEQQAARRLTEDLQEMREQIAAVRAGASRQVERLQRERDAAVRARDAARAEARDLERDRDAARRAHAAAQRERDATVRARDKARQERNEWLSRARAAEAKRHSTPAPEPDRPASGRDTHRAKPKPALAEPKPALAEPKPALAEPQPAARAESEAAAPEGDASTAGPSWTARLIALAALVFLLAIVALIVSWAV